MGGTVALMAAAERPDMVAGLVLFEPVILSKLASLYARAPWTSGRLWRRMPLARTAARRRSVFASAAEAFAAYKGRGAFRTWPEIMLADYVASGFAARRDGRVELVCDPQWEASNYAAQANDPWSALGKVRCATTVYRGEHRSTCHLGSGRGALRLNPRVKMHTVAGTSHFLPMERVEVVRDALLDAMGDA
jgi:pimeloyl-ACP methyl ester carboxylesterase